MMNIKCLAFLILMIGLALQAPAQRVCRGSVLFAGKGVANVVVTDGQTCVTTDKKGYYRIQITPESEFIYLSTPAGYLPSDSLNIPRFYQKIRKGRKSDYDFKLKKNPRNELNHVVMVHSDPQFYKEGNFSIYKRIIDDCTTTVGQYDDRDVFGIDCGDLVGDKPDLYPMYIQHLNQTSIPFYRVIGNHDMNYGGRSDETSAKTYSNIFGPTYYSFNRGKVHYIVLDNVFYFGRDYFYMGYITEKILHWLEQDLAYVPKGSTVFVAMHIPARLSEKPQPFAYTSERIGSETVNASSLFQMLKPYQTHILTGHMHSNKNCVHASNVYEHNTAAICGTWWQGDYCLDGTPLGYGVYEIEGDSVTWYFKSVGKSRNYQMRAYPRGSNAGFPQDVIANVWNWDKSWQVEWFENGQNKGAMTRFEAIDPEVAKMCADKDKLEFKWIAPETNGHMFRATPEQPNSLIKIRVTDRFGNVYEETI